MMQLVCNGVALDLPEDAGLQFTQENPLFAFDNLKCERTTQFKLPATATNDRVLSVARVPAYSGEGMRRKFAAQLQAGAIVKNGLLYVTTWNGKEYDAVFVTGEMIGLQAIKDAGKITDILTPSGGLVWDAAHVQDANAPGVYSADVALARYLVNATPCHPSFDLGGIMAAAYTAVTGRTAPTYTRGFRVIPKELQGMPKTACTLTYTGTNNQPGTSEVNPPYANTLNATGFGAAVDTIEQVLYAEFGGTQGQDRWFNLRQWRALQSIILTFPDDFPDDLFLLSVKDTGADGSDPEYNPLSADWFLGDYSFHRVASGGTAATGTPLRGRSVEIPSGTPFVILSRDWYEYDSGFRWDGFRWLSDNDGYAVEVTAKNDKIAVGDTIRIKDILPDLTVTDLLKIHAYLTGTVLNYTDADGVTFDPLEFDTWERVDITQKKMTDDEVRRVFADYAQRNTIDFDSAEDVQSNTRVRAEYTIDNDNLDELKTLATIPFSEGELAAADGFICPRFDAEDVEKNTLPKDGIYFATPQGGAYGQRVTLTPNARLQDLCDASTQIIVTAWMTAEEYEAINAKTLILCDGTLYAWTARQWQKNAAKFTLARIK